MTTRLRTLAEGLRTTFWFIPVLMTLAAHAVIRPGNLG
jgi:hypothetical protein